MSKVWFIPARREWGSYTFGLHFGVYDTAA